MIRSFKGIDRQRLVDIAWDLIHIIQFYGSPEASESTANKRMNLCKSCPEYDLIDNICLNCGCNLEHKTKDLLDQCPLDKWPMEEEEWKDKFYETVQDFQSNNK